MKIAILTLFHGNINWGGVLQGYALKTALEDLALACGIQDCHVDLIDYRGGANPVYPTLKEQMRQYSLSEKLGRGFKMVWGKVFRKKKLNLAERRRLFFHFMEEMRTDPRAFYDNTLRELGEEYDAVISGSDQVWNPNALRRGYLQTDIPDTTKKIAYAASIARPALSEHERAVMLPAIRRFDAVSLREKSAVKFLSDYLGGDTPVSEVLDPTLLLPKEKWEELKDSRYVGEEPYAIAFFFSESLAYRRLIEAYCRQKGWKLKFMPHAANKFLKSDEKGECQRYPQTGPKDFLALMASSQAVFTDSFHGTVFSLIFEKPFCVFERDKNTKTSKNSRLYDLLDNFSLSSRLLRGGNLQGLTALMDTPIDFVAVREEKAGRREASLAFLRSALGWTEAEEKAEKPSHKSILAVSEAACCGCEGCVSACPKGCIQMKKTREGFYAPTVNTDTCIECGLCRKACPVLFPHEGEAGEKKALLAMTGDAEVRKNSSSGGIFYHLAMQVIEEGGTVWGVALDDRQMPRHVRATCREELLPCLTSKYVQAVPAGAYRGVIEDLKAGHTVLYSGTPCQVVAMDRLATHLKLREKLILVDFICHGVPSPGVWESYLDYLREHRGEVTAVSFRDKTRGWHDFSLRVSFIDGSMLCESKDENAYMQTFLSDRNLRSSCYACPAKGDAYASDLTLADAWKVEKVMPKWADDKGTSLLVVRSLAGEELLKKVDSQISLAPTDYHVWNRTYNPSLRVSSLRPYTRGRLFDRYAKEGKELWAKKEPVSRKAKLKYMAKRILKKTGLEKLVRKFH